MAATDLLLPARDCLDELREELARHGAHPDPGLELRAVPGLLSHYDMLERHIYIGVHDPERPESRLMVYYLGGLLGLDESRLLRAFRLLLPWTVAHELAHHLRHRTGRFGAERWQEEIVAHELGGAVFSEAPKADRDQVRRLLRDGRECLVARLDVAGPTDPARALHRHLDWIMIGLSAREHISIEGWVRARLGP